MTSHFERRIMAQDLFFLPLDGKPFTYDRDIVLGILSKGAVQPVVDHYVAYPDGSRGEAHAIEDDPDQVLDHIGFVHFGGKMMMERIFELAHRFPVVLAWSDTFEGEPNAGVARAEWLEQVAPDYEPLNVVYVRDPSHLNQLVKGVTFEENGW